MTSGTSEGSGSRLLTLAAFIRGQVALADRPPPGCVQLNNDEALLAAEALELIGATPLLDDVIRRHVMLVLDQCGGDKRAAAQLLGVSLKTVYNWLARWSVI